MSHSFDGIGKASAGLGATICITPHCRQVSRMGMGFSLPIAKRKGVVPLQRNVRRYLIHLYLHKWNTGISRPDFLGNIRHKIKTTGIRWITPCVIELNLDVIHCEAVVVMNDKRRIIQQIHYGVRHIYALDFEITHSGGIGHHECVIVGPKSRGGRISYTRTCFNRNIGKLVEGNPKALPLRST